MPSKSHRKPKPKSNPKTQKEATPRNGNAAPRNGNAAPGNGKEDTPRNGMDRAGVSVTAAAIPNGDLPKLKNKPYEKELRRLQIELLKLQEWVKHEGLRVLVLFEGRDAAGKGGAIKRISDSMNPRVCRVVALGTPTDRERGQWYFQRYVAHLPARGEIVLFDRSWYNRAGVERVMGFCTKQEYREFMRSVPEFERMLVRSGIILLKYWFSVSDDEQEKRFRQRIKDPTKRWKISPMDLEARPRWVEFSRAKDKMFAETDTNQAPWYVVEADDKKRARLNCISHLLSMIPYKDLTPGKIKVPKRQKDNGYVRPPLTSQTFVQDCLATRGKPLRQE